MFCNTNEISLGRENLISKNTSKTTQRNLIRPPKCCFCGNKCLIIVDAGAACYLELTSSLGCIETTETLVIKKLVKTTNVPQNMRETTVLDGALGAIYIFTINLLLPDSLNLKK